MILLSERASYITVFKANFEPKISVVDIGEILRISDVWKIHFTTRNLKYLSDHLYGSEKRQIIGMLDKLNGITGRDDRDMERRWNEIIGR